MQAIEVSERAVFARVSRRLRRVYGEVLRRTREGSRGRFDLGEFYTVNTRYNVIAEKDVELEGFARQIGVLRDEESMRV